MKKFAIFFVIGFTFLSFFPLQSSAVTINLYGKAGAYLQNGKWKICPGFRFKKCASLEVSWKEIKDLIFGSEQPIPAIVHVYTEEGQFDYTLSVKIVGLNASLVGETPPEYIMGDDIVFEPN